MLDPKAGENTGSIEMVQRRVARFVLRRYRNTSSVSDMLDQLQWESLEDRHAKGQINLMFKIVNGLAVVDHAHLVPSTSRTRSAHSSKFLHYHCKNNIFKFSFFPRVVPVWNRLPASVVESQSLAAFKKGLASIVL